MTESYTKSNENSNEISFADAVPEISENIESTLSACSRALFRLSCSVSCHVHLINEVLR